MRTKESGIKNRPYTYRLKENRFYFSRTMERRFFFFMTLAMLLAGLVHKFL